MSITLTERAAKEIQRYMAEQNCPPDTSILRVGVAGGGCSGFEYRLGFDNQSDPAQDRVFEQHGIKIAIDKRSELLLEGTKLDFYEDLERRGFVFNNPNAQNSCGCGKSFSA